MEFGKISDSNLLARMNLGLPPIENRTIHRLQTASKTTQIRPEGPTCLIGTSTWAKKEWVGTLYPDQTPARNYLSFYAKQFNSIELNSTFYQIPDPKVIQNWSKSVPNGFQFCPKVFQGISHQPNLSFAESGRVLHRFLHMVLHFEKTLGMPLLQLPPYFHFGQLNLLQQWLEMLPADFPLAIEFRHSSWFANQSLRQKAYDLLCERHITSVITDSAGRRDVVHGSLTSTSTFIRFLGNQLHHSDFQRIDQWVARIGEWIQAGLQKIYFFVHQPNDITAPDLIHYLIQQLNQKHHLKINSWTPVKKLESQLELW